MCVVVKLIIFLIGTVISVSSICPSDKDMLHNSDKNLIYFKGKPDELEDDNQYVFYNTKPNIGLSGLIPQRSGHVRLSDNLFLQLLPHCGCSRCKFFCSCCSQIRMEALNIDTMVCLKVEYLDKEIGFSYKVTVNDDVYMQKEVSVKNPPPVCFMIPTPLPRMKSGACIRIYEIEVDGDERTVHGCVKLSFTLLNSFSSNYELGCFHINVNKVRYFGNFTDSDDSMGINQEVIMEKLKDYKVDEKIFQVNPFFKEENDKKEDEINSSFSKDAVFIDTNNTMVHESKPEVMTNVPIVQDMESSTLTFNTENTLVINTLSQEITQGNNEDLKEKYNFEKGNIMNSTVSETNNHETVAATEFMFS